MEEKITKFIITSFAAAAILASGIHAARTQQQPPDPAFMQKAIAALQAQRNTALDAQAMAESRAAMLADEVVSLKRQIDDLKKKAEPEAPPSK
jgi:hypothetical protein